MPPPHYNHSIILQAHYNLVTTVTMLSQHCNTLTTPPQAVTTLQACDKVIHVRLIIFILTKTLRKSIEIHSTVK